MFAWIKKKIFPPKEKGLVPEKYYVVQVDEQGVVCTTPKGERSAITWDELKTAHIETNDTGPWFCDVWWLLEGDNSFVAIPQDATGEKEFIDCLLKLPQFDYDAMIAAMSCTSNRRFTCWVKVQ